MTNDQAPVRISNWTQATGTQLGRRAVRKVAVVSRYPHERAIELCLTADDCDIVCVESPANAYSQIRRIRPNLVLMYLEIDDEDALQVLSILKSDTATAGIPVTTYIVASQTRAAREPTAVVRDDSRQVSAAAN